MLRSSDWLERCPHEAEVDSSNLSAAIGCYGQQKKRMLWASFHN